MSTITLQDILRLQPELRGAAYIESTKGMKIRNLRGLASHIVRRENRPCGFVSLDERDEDDYNLYERLGASAGWRLLSILAFQSFEDLRDCPADLDPDMVRGATLENCALQLSYRIKDDETAEALAACTGEILVDVEVKDIDRNAALVETVGGRSIRQSQRWLIDKNMIKSLPIPDKDKKTIGCGVLIGASQTAKFCFTSPVMVEREESAIKSTTLPPAASEIIESTSERLMSLPDLPDNHFADSAPE